MEATWWVRVIGSGWPSGPSLFCYYNCWQNSIKIRGEKRGKGFHWPKEERTLGKCKFYGFEVTVARPLVSSGIPLHVSNLGSTVLRCWGAHLTCVTVSVATDARTRAGLRSPGSPAVTATARGPSPDRLLEGKWNTAGMEGLWGNTNKLVGEILC